MEEQILSVWEKELSKLPRKVKLIITEKESTFFSEALKKFAHLVSSAGKGKLPVIIESQNHSIPQFPDLPALTLSCPPSHNIHYLAIPEGLELLPFLKTIKLLAYDSEPLAYLKKLLPPITAPVDIRVFISPYCANCPSVVETVTKFASIDPLISAFIIDIHNFKGLADQYNLKSVPAIIINQEIVLIGSITEKKLSETLSKKDAFKYQPQEISSLIQSGLAFRVADLICQNQGREVILELFQQGDLFTRLGILVALEEAWEKNPTAIREMVPQLLDLLSHPDYRIRGDIADFLGKIGDPKVIPYLQKLTKDPHPEVAEIAVEAIESVIGAFNLNPNTQP